jgi:NCS1 family nucleobase:cation symporter-1
LVSILPNTNQHVDHLSKAMEGCCCTSPSLARPNERWIDYWAYWCSDMLAPPLASTVSSVMALGFTARETIPIVFFGFLICSFVITATGKMGATYNVPFPVIVRSIFGMYGSFPAICIRAFVALM